MGKASSSKKVARAAGTGGGRTSRGRTPWTYFGVLALVVVLGLVGAVTSRDRRLGQINSAGATQPTVGTAWNVGFAVYECGKFLPNIKTKKDPVGITTTGDGIIHVHPTVKSAAGTNATLGKFASSIGMSLNAGELQVPGGKLYHDGDSCGGKPSHVYVKVFPFAGDATGTLQTVDPRDVRLYDQNLITVAFGPAAQKNSIPPPPAAVQNTLKALAATSATTTLPKTSATTAPATATTTPATAPSTTTPTTVASTSTTVKK